ncbi:MAG: hypothetical protein HYZ86_04325 [Candidatus Omnitrophica bacterium]|nr:hypothetical protein [Candidatus Omnitrophota bacterium]
MRKAPQPHTPKVDRKKEDTEFEIGFYEKIIADTPNFIEALAALGDLYTKAGYWQKGLDVDTRLSGLKPDDPVISYNLACSYALLNQTRAAWNALSKAIELGYDDFRHLRSDGDLENLLKDAHVQAFIKQLEKKKN